MKMTAADALAAPDVEYDVVKDAWGPGKDQVIRSLDAEQTMDWMDAREKNKREAGLQLIISSCMDSAPDPKNPGAEAPKAIFTAEHLGALKKKPSRITYKLVTAILELNGLAEKKDAAEKNPNA